jgi:hypothetical protein
MKRCIAIAVLLMLLIFAWLWSRSTIQLERCSMGNGSYQHIGVSWHTDEAYFFVIISRDSIETKFNSGTVRK